MVPLSVEQLPARIKIVGIVWIGIHVLKLLQALAPGFDDGSQAKMVDFRELRFSFPDVFREVDKHGFKVGKNRSKTDRAVAVALVPLEGRTSGPLPALCLGGVRSSQWRRGAVFLARQNASMRTLSIVLDC